MSGLGCATYYVEAPNGAGTVAWGVADLFRQFAAFTSEHGSAAVAAWVRS